MNDEKLYLALDEDIVLIDERDMPLVPYDDDIDMDSVPTGYWATRKAIRGKKAGVNVYKKTKLSRLNQQIKDLQFQKTKVRQTARLDKKRHAQSMWSRRREKLLQQQLGLDPGEKLYKADVQYKPTKGKPGRYSKQNLQGASSGRERAHQTNFQSTAQPVTNRRALQQPDHGGYMDGDRTDWGSRSRAARMSQELDRMPVEKSRSNRPMKNVTPRKDARRLTRG